VQVSVGRTSLATVPLASELDLPTFDNTDPQLRGERYRDAMAALGGHDGWLAAGPFGFIVLDREGGEFFLRTKDAVFPGLAIGELFGIADGPLHEEIVKNIININGDDHRRLRNLVNPALAPRTVDRYRPAMQRFLSELFAGLPADGRCEFIEAFAKPYPSLVIAEVMGAPLSDAPRLYHWSNWIQRQFDATSLMTERSLIEDAVADFYEYADALIETRRRSPAEDLITDLISAEEAGDRLSHDELRNLVLNVLVGGVDTSQSQLAHAVRLLAAHPDQWQALRADPRGLALAAVDEALRFEPITPFTARITVAEIEFRGVTFPAGSIVLISAWHANRDGADPPRFDIKADPGPGGQRGRGGRGRILTFGAGIHYCVGANLARAEMEKGLAFLAENVESIEPAGEPSFGTPSGIYGLETLPLRLSPAVSAAMPERRD
jgi:cytochrome P450